MVILHEENLSTLPDVIPPGPGIQDAGIPESFLLNQAIAFGNIDTEANP